MTHIWIRAEERPNEQRVGVTPGGVTALVQAGFQVTLEEDPSRAIALADYTGCSLAATGSWRTAPKDAIIFGLKELPDDDNPLVHRHIMFGHAYKGQPDGARLLERFKRGGGRLYDLEYLTDDTGRRVAAFGYWAGYAGAAVALKCWAAARSRALCAPLQTFTSAGALQNHIAEDLGTDARPKVIIIGAQGRVGSGARDFCDAIGAEVTGWDIVQTTQGGPFPEILTHEIFLNCILASASTPEFVPASALSAPRNLRVIGDIACDPGSDFSPIKVYDRTTSWEHPALRVHDNPILDVTAIDNLPSLLPRESSEDFALQLLPSLLGLHDMEQGVWSKAGAQFDHHLKTSV
jgi:saccharopine dehydrogenase (NAD+, L-lysine-forming)